MGFGSGVSAGGRSGSGGVAPRATGWAIYRDQTYTLEAPLSLDADVRTQLPNAAQSRDESQLPDDLLTFYDPITGKIKGTRGGDYVINVRLRITPRDADTTFVKIELDLGPDAAPQVIETAGRALPWGMDQETAHSFVYSGFVSPTFETNGCRLFITSDGPADVYSISYVIKRTHKGV